MRFPIVRSLLVTEGLNRTLRGIRTGDQRTLYTGAALLGLMAVRHLNHRRVYLLRGNIIDDGGTYIIRTSTQEPLSDLGVRMPDGSVKDLAGARLTRRGRTRVRLYRMR